MRTTVDHRRFVTAAASGTDAARHLVDGSGVSALPSRGVGIVLRYGPADLVG
jgi:hypothetical protein